MCPKCGLNATKQHIRKCTFMFNILIFSVRLFSKVNISNQKGPFGPFSQTSFNSQTLFNQHKLHSKLTDVEINPLCNYPDPGKNTSNSYPQTHHQYD
jgi:hypothetical protein